MADDEGLEAAADLFKALSSASRLRLLRLLSESASSVSALVASSGLAQPLVAAPIFADPTGEPIGYLPREAAYGGTTVPVIVRDTHWVKVLLAGRQGVTPAVTLESA